MTPEHENFLQMIDFFTDPHRGVKTASRADFYHAHIVRAKLEKLFNQLAAVPAANAAEAQPQ